MKRYFRHSRATTRSKRWKALRLEALRRDGFKCRQCGARDRLEVDHIKPVRAAPELAYELGNLQCLCPPCHSKKTHAEIGRPQKSEAAKQWSIAITELSGSK